MSMQRVLETARKFGLPVIVTDVAGRDPMVLMPLEQFEALTESGGEPREFSSAAAVEPVVTPLVEPRRVPEPEHAQKPHVSTEKPRVEPVGISTAEPSEMPLEEQFFLEPVDEDGQ